MNETYDKSLVDLFPNAGDFIGRISGVASCLPFANFSDKILHYVSNGGLPISIERTLTNDTTENWDFPVVHGRSGTIATAVDGAVIDANSTIELLYALVESPGANDWKRYDNGLFTGAEVNKIVEFVGRWMRVKWTPNANEDLNVMVAL